MLRAITGYHLDDEGDVVAELSCGHGQHVRHRPPFQLRPWVLDEAGRTARIGSTLSCPRCDDLELPEERRLRLARTTPLFDERSIPAGLRRSHKVAPATWAVLHLEHGRLRFSVLGDAARQIELEADALQAIPPELEHEVAPLGACRFLLRFYEVSWR